MNLRGDEYGEIKDIIAREIRYLKTYTGKVLSTDDELKRGRVKLAIPELGWLTEDQSPWTEPEYPLRGCIVPDVGDWVTVFFLAGNPARPVYRSRTGEIKESWPTSYTGPEIKVLYEDADITILYDGSVITVDAGPKKVRVKNDKQNLATLIGELMDDLLNLQTAGSSTSHVLAPSSTSSFNTLKTKFTDILEE